MPEKAASNRYIRTEKLDRRKDRGDAFDDDAWYDKQSSKTVYFPAILKHDPNNAPRTKRGPMKSAIDPDVLALVPQQRQAQGSVHDQLVALYAIANRFGLYDAADCVQKLIEPKRGDDSLR